MSCFKGFVNKLKAIQTAEGLGYYCLAKKIAQGMIHTDAVKSINLLSEEELNNPIYQQAALMANQFQKAEQTLYRRYASLV